ncbi:TPA: YxeA family protein [Bacillus cereus]|uniref:YxeA family protein n=1 Tax=Bacillus cereus TaxID=1396 RepID=UPI00065C1845|nr:YxeA family protein [Bacillus cereus]KMQ22116.1 membrane protein [Bacillus cereus]
MKKYTLFLNIFSVFIILLTGCSSIKRIGTEKYYVQINMNGNEVIHEVDGGEKLKRFEYELKGFNEDGEEKKLKFDAEKNLRKEAFLRVHYSKEKGVKTWEEVKKEEIPKKAREKLEKK